MATPASGAITPCWPGPGLLWPAPATCWCLGCARAGPTPLGAPPHPASSPALALGGPVQWHPGPIASHPTPGLTAPPSPDPLTGQLIVPANSRQLGPRGTLPAYRLSMPPPIAARPPSSGLCGHLTPPSSPSIGIWPSPVRLPLPIISSLYPSSLVSTTGTSRFGGFGISGAKLRRGTAPNTALAARYRRDGFAGQLPLRLGMFTTPPSVGDPVGRNVKSGLRGRLVLGSVGRQVNFVQGLARDAPYFGVADSIHRSRGGFGYRPSIAGCM